ncbi:MAG TPA: MATE family efflux transporter [Prolixibacteraceae bacterium]|nr:MATE family efflux transporter [Prolixibacteraceae bacterium]
MTLNITIKQILQEIKDALRGEEHDYTQGSLKRAVFLLAIPMVLEMCMESIFAIVDIFFVSRLGADAIATVGLTESVITIIYALAFGLSSAASAIISRRVGEKKYHKASLGAWQAILSAIAVSLIIAIPGLIFAKDILRLMNASDTIVNQMSGYASIMFGCNGVIMLLFMNNAIFRSTGNPVLSMKVLFFANLINLILDPILIFGWGPIPAFGVQGAAMATTTGRGLAVLYQFYLLGKGKGKIALAGISYRPNFRLIGKLINLSLGSVSQNIIATSSWIILMRLVAVYGSEVLAGYTISLRIITFVLLPASGISNAASTLVGQNLGAGNPLRAEKSAWISSRINVILMGIITLIILIWAKWMVGMLASDSGIVDLGVISLRIVSAGLIIYGLGMVMVNAFNGAGDTQTPFRINIVAFWLVEIPLAWLLSSKTGMAEQGVFWAIIIAESLMTFASLYFFKKGNWKLKEV